jgi:hypothetical protein
MQKTAVGYRSSLHTLLLNIPSYLTLLVLVLKFSFVKASACQNFFFAISVQQPGP